MSEDKELQSGMLQRTVFIDKIRMLQRTQMLQRLRRNTIGLSGLPALIRASVFIFVIVCKFQLSVQFSYLLIYAFSSVK